MKIFVNNLNKSGNDFFSSFPASPSRQPSVVSVATDGIDVERWDTNDGIKFNCFDFAGQDIYYPTHQFFTTGKQIWTRYHVEEGEKGRKNWKERLLSFFPVLSSFFLPLPLDITTFIGFPSSFT